jgi:predicted trehalose synthase
MISKLTSHAGFAWIASACIAALWWASDLSRRVDTMEHSTVTAERLARLESEVHALGETTGQLRQAVADLSRNLRSH